MSLKANIFYSVPTSEIPNRVASEFREIVDVTRLGSGLFTVVSYPSMRGSSTSIVDSNALGKTLKKAGAKSEKIVVVAHGFTSEAHALLIENNAIGFFKSDFFWSDESWARIRDNK